MYFSFLHVILFVCFYLVLPILYVSMRNETRAKKNIVLGVTLPYDARHAPQVEAVCARFRRNLTIQFVLLTALALLSFCIRWQSVVLTYDMLWMIAACIAPSWLYARANRTLRRLKAEAGWSGALRGKTLVDLRAAELPAGGFSPLWFLPPALCSLLPCIWTLAAGDSLADAWPMLLTTACLAALCCACYPLYRVIVRQPAEVIDEKTELSVALTRVRRYNWGKSMLAIAWLTGLYALAFWLLLERSAIGLLVATALYTFALIAVCLQTEFAARRAQEKLTASSGTDDYADEDAHWLLGMFYYNKNDRHFMKNNRVGVGTTVNLARPGAKVLMGFAALCILALPFVGVWTMLEEFTPVSVYGTEEAVVAEHVGSKYTVPFDAIVSFAVLPELPPLRRVAGTGMETVYKGRFRAEGYGTCFLCLDPRAAQFLLLETASRVYIFSTDTQLVQTVEEAVAGRVPA